jgi:beta-lactam-binding protein with PASTA domain
MANVGDRMKRVGEKVRPGRDFAERRAVVKRGRSATWQVMIALIAATVGATALGYLAVQLYFLPETLREARLHRVPDLTSMELDDASDKGEASGYVVSVVGRDFSDEVEAGEVIYQSPPPDMYLPRGDTLWVLVSLGSADERIPDLAGLDLELARRVLAQMDIRAPNVSREASDIHPQGTVIRTDPPAGTPLADLERAAVGVVLSRGGSRLTMPDIRDLTLAEARDTLEVYSLMVGEVTGLAVGEQPAEGARVVVTDQRPPPGRLVPAGSPVDVTLGPARARRPTVESPRERQPLPPPRDETIPEVEPPADEPLGPRFAPPDTAPR